MSKYSSPQKIVSTLIRAAYARVPDALLRPPPPASVANMIATITARGIGDCLMLTDLPVAAIEQKRVVAVWANIQTFLDVMAFHPTENITNFDQGRLNPFLVDILRLNECYDLGNGHQLQRLRRAWRLPVMLRPQPALKQVAVAISNRVILHFEPSVHNVTWQRQHWHPRMREFYPESKLELEKFIKRRKDLEFIELGQESLGLKGVTFIKAGSTAELIKTIQTGSWFIGIMSGPMHIAVASGMRCMVVVNYPPAKRVVLPCLKWTGTPEEEWMYPQNVHLHQESESPLVPRFSAEALQAAFSGDVYPFWQDTWLGMIENL